MKKLLALSAVGVLAFAACGDDDDDGGSDTTEVETITSEVTEESVVSEESEVVEGTTVESEVTEESVVTEESIVVETKPESAPKADPSGSARDRRRPRPAGGGDLCASPSTVENCNGSRTPP